MGVRRRSSNPLPVRAERPPDLLELVRALPDVVAAERLAAALLATDPARLRHLRTAAAAALLVSGTVGPARLETLVAATVLHDIGYAPQVRSTGSHPLDGGEWLQARGAPPGVAGAVAHHCEATLLPGSVALLGRYSALPQPEPPIADAVTYADQTTSPDGRRMPVVERMLDRRRRKPPAAGLPRETDRLRAERLVHAVSRVVARLAALGDEDGLLHAVDRHLLDTLPGPEHPDVDAVLETRGVLPQRLDGLDGRRQVAAAVHAAGILCETGIEPGWVDVVTTAGRLLGGAELVGVPRSVGVPGRVGVPGPVGVLAAGRPPGAALPAG